MSNLKNQLIKLGSKNPDLQKHIRPVLDRVVESGFDGFDPVPVLERALGNIPFHKANPKSSKHKEILSSLQKAKEDVEGGRPEEGAKKVLDLAERGLLEEVSEIEWLGQKAVRTLLDARDVSVDLVDRSYSDFNF